ncbi:MAG: hypothetical protein NTW87_14535 [Planctomycetota bacterium]|nr:hypothetical protein [Planctomycetota bacterium]
MEPATRAAVAELKDKADDIDWFSHVNRFGVTAVAEDGVESELIDVALPPGN